MSQETLSARGHLFNVARAVTIAVGVASPIGGIFMESGSVSADNSQPAATHELLPSPTPTGIIGEPWILTPTPTADIGEPWTMTPFPTRPTEPPTPAPTKTFAAPTPTVNIGEPWSMTPFPAGPKETPSYIADVTPKELPKAGGAQEDKNSKTGLAEAITILGLTLTLPGIELFRKAAKKSK